MISAKLLFFFNPLVSGSRHFPIMPRQFQFQLPFDSTAYQHAKAKGKEAKGNGPSDEKLVSGTKPIYSKRGKSESTTGTSSTVSMNASEEFPPVEMLLPMDVYDLTTEDESLVELPKPTYQQATQASERKATQEEVTQEQATQERATQERAIQGQPTQGQPTQGLATQEQAQATPEVEDSNDRGVHCVPWILMIANFI